MKTKSILVLAIIVLFAIAPLACESALAFEIVAWGSTSFGKCDVPVGNDIIGIAASRVHSLALRSDGSLLAWGYNDQGQCNVPVGNDFVAIAAGDRHSLSLRTDGSLVGWGENYKGQCDVPEGNNFAAIAAGFRHSLAIKKDGSLEAWGYNYYGQCDVPEGNDFVAIAGGYDHSLALKSDGSLVAWGQNWYGVCDVPSGSDFVATSAYGLHNLALKSDGSSVAWGYNFSGQCNVPSGNDFAAIAAGCDHSLALRKDGSLEAWGYNYYGQCNVPAGNNFVEITAGGFHNLALVGEPTMPPVADADGPYSIYVGDTLTLDASGSTDADNDIVSYMWDLDDDESFETDAGAQAVFDVNYTSLQLLGLIVDHTYNIHVKVTDSEGQSDVADSTFIIVPKPAVKVTVDIKPGSCPNPVNVKSSSVLPVAILGTGDVNVIDIDPTSIAFSFGEVNVGAIRCSYEDVAGPVSDSNDCNCITDGPDGFLDLTLKFKTQEIVNAVGNVNDGDELQLELIGVLFDETPIEGADCILIRGRHKPINPADINKDGVVDMFDLAILAENWLESSIVGE